MRSALLTTLTLTALLAACSGAAERKSDAILKGRDYMTAKNYEKARLEFRNALQLDPNDAESAYLSGQAAEKLGNIREAAQMYQTAIDSNSKHVGARAMLGRLYAMGGAPDKALELVEPALATSPNDPDLLITRGTARQIKSDSAGARADAEKAVRIAPDSENAVAMLAAIYARAGETQLAIDTVSKAVARPGDHSDLRLVLAQLYLGANRRPDAVKELRALVAAQPDNLPNRYRLAQVLMIDKNVDGAEAELRAAIKQAPDNAEPKLMLANLLATARSYDVAATELQRLSAASPNDFALRLGVAQFFESHGKASNALAIYQSVIKDDGDGPNGLTARNRLAAGYIATNQFDKATPLVEEVLKKNPRDNDALIARANIALAQGKATAAIADIRAVQRDQPNSIPLQRALARAYLQNDDRTLAEETLRAAVQAHQSDVNLRLDLARLLARTNRSDQALPMLQKLATEQPDNRAVLEELFGAQMARKDNVAAKKTAALMAAAKAGQPAGNYMTGMAELAEGKTDAARNAFERALELSPASAEPVAALVRLDLMQKKPEQAVARLDKLLTESPSNPTLINMRAEVLATMNRLPDAEAGFRSAIAKSPAWTSPYRGLAAVQLAGGKTDAAIQTLREGMGATKQSPVLITDLAAVYERYGRIDDGVALYEGLLKANPEATALANNLAMLLVSYRTDRASLDRARVLSEAFAKSNNASLIDTWGWVQFKRGEFAPAVATLQSAVDKAPDSPVLRYHLAMAQLKTGATAEARANLERALKNGESFSGGPEAKIALASLVAAK